MKIYVRQFTREAGITILPQGDWFDLSVSMDTMVNKGAITYIPLGVAMKMPKGMEAIMVSRSSTPKKRGVFMPSAIGVIDNSYCGNNDEWKFPALPVNNSVTIKAGTRIAQFRIQPSQKATFFDKLKWLLNGKIKFVYVDSLDTENRGGLGSTD